MTLQIVTSRESRNCMCSTCSKTIWTPLRSSCLRTKPHSSSAVRPAWTTIEKPLCERFQGGCYFEWSANSQLWEPRKGCLKRGFRLFHSEFGWLLLAICSSVGRVLYAQFDKACSIYVIQFSSLYNRFVLKIRMQA